MIRTTRPVAGNKYFITKDNGGYSTCIKGKPTDSQCNVLSNCVGYACGAFNEELALGYEKYHLNCNAENFIERAIASGLSVVQKPCIGAIACWEGKGGLAGHVAIVVDIIDDNTIKFAESGYGRTTPFWTSIRNNNNGRWGLTADYPFRGFIVNPNYPPAPNPTPKPTPEMKYKIGDKVQISGRLYGTADGGNPGQYVNNKVTNITRIAKGHPYPYNTTGDLGWIAESQIKSLGDVTSFEIGDTVIVTGPLYYTPNDAKPTGYAKDKRTKITRKLDAKKYKHPYNTTGDYGWCDASSLKKV